MSVHPLLSLHSCLQSTGSCCNGSRSRTIRGEGLVSFVLAVVAVVLDVVVVVMTSGAVLIAYVSMVASIVVVGALSLDISCSVCFHSPVTALS